MMEIVFILEVLKIKYRIVCFCKEIILVDFLKRLFFKNIYRQEGRVMYRGLRYNYFFDFLVGQQGLQKVMICLWVFELFGFFQYILKFKNLKEKLFYRMEICVFKGIWSQSYDDLKYLFCKEQYIFFKLINFCQYCFKVILESKKKMWGEDLFLLSRRY